MKKIGLYVASLAIGLSLVAPAISANASSVNETIDAIVDKHNQIRLETTKACMDKLGSHTPDENLQECVLEVSSIWADADKFTDQVEYVILVGNPSNRPVITIKSRDNPLEIYVHADKAFPSFEPVPYKIRSGKNAVIEGKVAQINDSDGATFKFDQKSTDEIVKYLIDTKADNFLIRIGEIAIVDQEFKATGLGDALVDLVDITDLSKAGAASKN